MLGRGYRLSDDGADLVQKRLDPVRGWQEVCLGESVSNLDACLVELLVGTRGRGIEQPDEVIDTETVSAVLSTSGVVSLDVPVLRGQVRVERLELVEVVEALVHQERPSRG